MPSNKTDINNGKSVPKNLCKSAPLRISVVITRTLPEEVRVIKWAFFLLFLFGRRMKKECEVFDRIGTQLKCEVCDRIEFQYITQQITDVAVLAA